MLRRLVVVALSAGSFGCGEGGDLALSAGAPVVGMAEGTITDCGAPVPEAEVRLLVEQADIGQARPVRAELGPVISDRRGMSAIEVSPAFAIPGPALVRPRVRPPAGDVHEFPGRTMELSLGEAEDTLQLDADLGDATGGCPSSSQETE